MRRSFVFGARPGDRRAVSPIVATILMIAIVIVLSAILYTLVIGLGGNTSRPTLGTELAFGPVTEGQNATAFFYNFSVAAASGGITWSSVELHISHSGTIFTAGIVSYTVYTAARQVVCHASGSAVAQWSPGSGGTALTPISSTQQLVVVSTVSLSGQGATLDAAGTGSFGGTIHANIP
jgi:flagellin-like protein